MLARKPATKRPWRPRNHWQFTHAFGLKRSYTWFTAKGMEAAERRLANHVPFIDTLSPEALARLLACDYDGPWVRGRGVPLRKDLAAQ
jgi:hypothetical protein